MNDPLRTGGYEPRTRRGLLAVVVSIVVLFAAVIVAVVVFGGGSASEEEGSAANDLASSGSTTTSNPAAVSEGEDTTSQADGTETTTKEEEGSSGAEPDGSETSDDGSEGESEMESPEDRAAESRVVSAENDDGGPGQSSEDGDDSSESSGGRDGGRDEQPGTYDPLGTGAKPEDLTATDRDRARFVVSEFVIAGYGYAGEDATTYGRGIEELVVRPDFYDSPAGKQLSERVESFEEDYVKSAATLDRFKISRTEPGEVIGTAYYEAGPVDGSQSRYLQQITLVPDGASYKVLSASTPQEV